MLKGLVWDSLNGAYCWVPSASLCERNAERRNRRGLSVFGDVSLSRRAERRRSPAVAGARGAAALFEGVQGIAEAGVVDAQPLAQCGLCSPSATATVGACPLNGPHAGAKGRAPRGGSAVPHQGRIRNGTPPAIADPRPAHRLPVHSPDVGNPYRAAMATVLRQFPLTRSRDSDLPDRAR